MGRSGKKEAFLWLSLACFLLCAPSCQLTWTHGDVDTTDGYISDVRYDGNGGVHILYYTIGDKDAAVRYATCPGQCEDPNNWSRVVLLEGAVKSASLAVGSSGGVHVLIQEPSEATTGVYYTFCGGECGDPRNWASPVVLDFPKYTLYMMSNFNLVLDDNEHPRATIAGDDSVREEWFVDYLYCDDRCLQAEGWSSARIVAWRYYNFTQLMANHSLERNGPVYVMTYVGKQRWPVSGDLSLHSSYCLGDCTDPANWSNGPSLPVGKCDGVGISPFCYRWSPVKARSDGSAAFVGTKVDWGTGVPVTTLEYRSYVDPQGSDVSLVEIGQDLRSTSLALTRPPNPEAAPKPRIAALSEEGLTYVSCDSGCAQESNWRKELIDPLLLSTNDPADWPRMALDSTNLPGIAYKAIASGEVILRFASGSNVSSPWSPAEEAAASVYGERSSERGALANYTLLGAIPVLVGLLSLIGRVRRFQRRR